MIIPAQNRRAKNILKLIAVTAFLGVSIIIFEISSQWIKKSSAERLCFVLNEGKTDTYIIIEDSRPNALITIVERRDDKDVEPPSTGPGTLEKDAVVLVDGTRLLFNETRLIWPNGSLLAGSEFLTTDCPKF